MGLTAIDPDLGVLDTTLTDLGCGRDWATVHRARPRPRLSCPACQHRVHAKVSPGGVRFFAHDPGASRRCALAGESVAHHRLKLALAGAVRAGGHHAAVEATGPDGRWRADVLSTSPDGITRWAWEAQLSAITSEDIERRTARYAADGIGVCWVSDRPRNWLGTAPSLLVGTTAVGECPVESGVARFVTEECACSHGHRTCPAGRHGHWDGDRGAGLLDVVARILHAVLLPHAPTDPVGLGITGVWRWLWATPEAVEEAKAYAEKERVGRERWRRQQIEYAARRFPEANAPWSTSGSRR